MTRTQVKCKVIALGWRFDAGLRHGSVCVIGRWQSRGSSMQPRHEGKDGRIRDLEGSNGRHMDRGGLGVNHGVMERCYGAPGWIVGHGGEGLEAGQRGKRSCCVVALYSADTHPEARHEDVKGGFGISSRWWHCCGRRCALSNRIMIFCLVPPLSDKYSRVSGRIMATDMAHCAPKAQY
jgi:hypothetical protein